MAGDEEARGQGRRVWGDKQDLGRRVWETTEKFQNSNAQCPILNSQFPIANCQSLVNLKQFVKRRWSVVSACTSVRNIAVPPTTHRG
ncbi:MAG: hypothetical protein ACHBN1_13140 [Heteroscytonema crispum UTEX LB 1556]